MRSKRMYGAVAATVLVIIAVAVIALYPHHVELTSEGQGTVSPVSGDLRFYQTFEAEAVPADGWHVADVRADGAEAELDGNIIRIGVSPFRFSGSSVHVVFEEDAPVPGDEKHTVTVTSTSGGSIEPSGTITVEDGSSLTFSITPNPGYRLSSLYVDGRPVAFGIGTYVLEDIRGDRIVRAVFVRTGGGDTEEPAPVLKGLSVAEPPTRTVYSVGDVFDPSGMKVVATYSDGSNHELSSDEYTWSPSGPLSEGTSAVTVSYGGKTVDVPVKVVVPGGFQVMVTSFSGTYVDDGMLTEFADPSVTPISEFSFRTSGIVPGVVQTAEMTVRNGTSVDLGAVFYIDHLDLAGEELAGQVVLTVTAGGSEVRASISEMTSGTLLDLGTVSASGSIDITVTLEFPDSDDNNAAMGQAISFTLGVFADDLQGGSP